jgi:hypothetical protein
VPCCCRCHLVNVLHVPCCCRCNVLCYIHLVWPGDASTVVYRVLFGHACVACS